MWIYLSSVYLLLWSILLAPPFRGEGTTYASNQSGAGIRKPPLPQIAYESGYQNQLQKHIQHPALIYIHNHGYQKIKYPVIKYNHGSQKNCKKVKCPPKSRAYVDYFTKPGDSFEVFEIPGMGTDYLPKNSNTHPKVEAKPP